MANIYGKNNAFNSAPSIYNLPNELNSAPNAGAPNASKGISAANEVEDVPTDAFAEEIYQAIKAADLNMFKQVVNSSNINTYFSVKGGEYTPVLYLARKSPKGSKAMLEYCMELGADLTLKAQTSDCLGLFQNKRCTTIGNLAAFRQSKMTHLEKMTMYNLLNRINNGESVFDSELANENASKYKDIIPGFNYLNIARITLRGTVKGAAAAPVVAAGVGAGAALGLAGAVATAPHYASRYVASKIRGFGGRRRRTRKNKSRTRRN